MNMSLLIFPVVFLETEDVVEDDSEDDGTGAAPPDG